MFGSLMGREMGVEELTYEMCHCAEEVGLNTPSSVVENIRTICDLVSDLGTAGRDNALAGVSRANAERRADARAAVNPQGVETAGKPYAMSVEADKVVMADAMTQIKPQIKRTRAVEAAPAEALKMYNLEQDAPVNIKK